MSDIIKDAKQLLDGATPGPWNIDGAPHPGPDDELFIHPKDDGGTIARVQPQYADAELIAVAPELAQALAEETYEYSYQELRGDEWETAFNDVTHLEEWWPKKSDVDWIVEEARKHGYVCRLVRRRVSPVEVVNE